VTFAVNDLPSALPDFTDVRDTPARNAYVSGSQPLGRSTAWVPFFAVFFKLLPGAFNAVQPR
jgi:hypothetical protein